ncbi:MAG: metallophosphoesterase family protein [Candidatus Woesearchaeota archaeon]
MKFAHIADVHLGNYRDQKLKDLTGEYFSKAIDICIDKKVDFVLIAGDLYHTALPGIDQVKLVIRKLKELKDRGIRVYYIAGSHDYSPTGKTMLDIIEEADLGVFVMKGETKDKVLKLEMFKDEKTKAKITGIIGKRGMLDKHIYEDLDKESLEKEDGFKIFMFHTALSELKPDFIKMESYNTSNFLPKGFDYYAGGHVHIYENKTLEGYKNLVYPGPIFPANFSELERLRCGSFVIYEDGEIKRQKIELKKIILKEYDFDGKTVEEANKLLKVDEDVEDKIILIKIFGKLKSSNRHDINIKDLIEDLYERGAFFVLKNTNKLHSKDFEELDKSEVSAPEEVENEVIKKHLNQQKNNFKDEFQITKSLLQALSQEKNDGERNIDYEQRMIEEGKKVIKKD